MFKIQTPLTAFVEEKVALLDLHDTLIVIHKRANLLREL